MPTGFSRVFLFMRVHQGVALGELLHRETCLGKEFIDFIADLETIGTDARTNDGMEVLRACSIGGIEHVDIVFDDAFQSAFPTCMYGRDDFGGVVPKEDGNAIGGTDADADIGEVGSQSIHAVEDKCLFEWVHAEKGLVNHNRLGLMHLVQWHEETGDGNGDVAISCGGEGCDMGGSGVEVHFNSENYSSYSKSSRSSISSSSKNSMSSSSEVLSSPQPSSSSLGSSSM